MDYDVEVIGGDKVCNVRFDADKGTAISSAVLTLLMRAGAMFHTDEHSDVIMYLTYAQLRKLTFREDY